MSKPCIRGLREFKKGCPGNKDCTCWVTENFINKDTGGLEPKSMCVDMAQYHLTKSLLARTEGVQVATESFRNGMCETSPDGKVQPKSARFILDIRGGAPTLTQGKAPKQIGGGNGNSV